MNTTRDAWLDTRIHLSILITTLLSLLIHRDSSRGSFQSRVKVCNPSAKIHRQSSWGPRWWNSSGVSRHGDFAIEGVQTLWMSPLVEGTHRASLPRTLKISEWKCWEHRRFSTVYQLVCADRACQSCYVLLIPVCFYFPVWRTKSWIVQLDHVASDVFFQAQIDIQ